MTDPSIDRKIQEGYRSAYGEPEKNLQSREDAIGPTGDSVPRNCSLGKNETNYASMSPEAFETFRTTILPNMMRCIEAQKLSISSLDDEPENPRREASEAFIRQIEETALELGANRIGFTRVPRHLIFSEKAVLYEDVIVLGQDMDRSRIETSPSVEAMQATFEVYADLGEIANDLAAYLRKAGYGAQAGMSLGGLTFYPELAERAGIGIRGRHGLLISDGPGPGQRLSCVYTSIQNLPQPGENPHAWVAEFCNRCLNCVRLCPVGALYHDPLQKKPEGFVYLDADKCNPYFSDNHACGICIAECPFFRRDYATIREKFQRQERL